MLETFRDNFALPLQPKKLPTKDWNYVITQGTELGESRISGNIDGIEAYRKAVWKSFMTPRHMFVGYPSNYGSEFHLLKNKSAAYHKTRLPQMIQDCLEQDDRYVSHKIISMENDFKTIIVKLEIISTEGVFEYDLQLSLRGGVNVDRASITDRF